MGECRIQSHTNKDRTSGTQPTFTRSAELTDLAAMPVAVVQMASGPDKPDNIERAVALATQAAAAGALLHSVAGNV